MNAEGLLTSEPKPQQDTSSTEAGKRGRKSNWRGWQKRGRGGYRGRGHFNYSGVTNSTTNSKNNLQFNENEKESHQGGTLASEDDIINTVEQVGNANTLDDKENSFHGRPWSKRGQGGWRKWGSNERDEECQVVNSQEIKWPGRGRSGHKQRGRGRGKMQQCEGYAQGEKNLFLNSAEEMQNSNCGLTRDNIEVTPIGETDGETGTFAYRGRGFKAGRGRGYFRGRGRKKQSVNNEKKNQEEDDASSNCTDLSAREGGRERNSSFGRKDDREDANEHNNSSFKQYPGWGRGGYGGRGGQMHQRGRCIQKNTCSDRGEKLILSDEDLQQNGNLSIQRNSIEIASTETESTYDEAANNAGRGRGNKAGRGRGYFRGRGRKKQNFNNEGKNQEENSFKESRHLSGSGGGRFRAKDDSFMKYADSVERNDDEDVTEINDASYNNGYAAFDKNLRFATNNADVSLEDVSVASEENTFPKPRTTNRRGQWRNQYASESTGSRKNKVLKILDGCAEELVNENLNGFSNFPSADGSNSTENKEHFMEKPTDSAPFENNNFPKRRRRNRRRKWTNYYDKQNNTENILADDEELEKNTADDEHTGYSFDNNKIKETKIKVQQPYITPGDPGQFIHCTNNQEPKQDLDKNKDNNKISLQDLFSKAPPLVNKSNVQTNVPGASNLAVFTVVDTAPSQTMSLENQTVDVIIPRNVDSVASTSVATASPVTNTATTLATVAVASKAFTSDIQTPSTATSTVSSSNKLNPSSLSTSQTPSKSDLITILASTSIPVSNAQTTTSCKTVQRPTATSTASAKINCSVAVVSGSTNSKKISPSNPQSMPKTAIASNLTVTSSSPFTVSQSSDISLTAKSPTYVKQPVISNSSSLHQVSATGFSNHTNRQLHKTSLPDAVGINYSSTPQKRTTDSFTHSYASSAPAKRKTVSNYAVSHMTPKRNTGNCNKLEYQLTAKCKLVIKSYGDIVKEKSELLVCVLGSDADMRKTKVGQSFCKEFPNHWQELQHSYRNNPYSPVLTIHNPLGFIGKAICHILLTPWNKEKSHDQIDIALHELFNVVDDLNIQSISIPPLGCGLAFKFPPKYMVHWVLEHIKNMTIGRYLKKIVLLAPSSELFDEFKTRASKYFDYANTYIEEDTREDPIQTWDRDVIFNLKPKQGTLEYMNYLAEQETVFPSYWDHGKTDKKSTSTWWGFKSFVTNYFTGANKPYLVDVSEETKAAITKLVTGSQDLHVIGHGADAVGMNYSSIKVIDVQRIEQPTLFEKYHQKRKEILEKRIRKGFACQDVGKITGSKGKVLTKTLLCDSMKGELYSEINEHYLFHGTKEKALENIIVNGFDPNRSKALSLFGQGIYTAEKSTKADQYTDEKSSRSPNGTKLSLILARVLLGDVFVCDENHPRLESKVCRKLIKPPCMLCLEDLCLCGSEEHYDSVMGDGKWLFREFVVYEASQCYPEYLITYQRV